MKLLRKYNRVIAVHMLIFFCSTLVNVTSYAVTGHSSMPEYRSFEPANTDNMVNLFDGSFTYALPLLEVPNGYPITLSYHSSEINNEAQASWVGLGWTLNPGAINRMKRGFPDEFQGEDVTYYNRAPKNWTLTVDLSTGIEGFSKTTFGIGRSLSFNNYSGYNATIYGSVSDPLGISNSTLSYSEGNFGFDASLNISRALSGIANASKKKDDNKSDNLDRTDKKVKVDYRVSLPQSRSFPLNTIEQKGGGFNLQFDVGGNGAPAPVEPGEVSSNGAFAYKENVPEKIVPVYGYMHSDQALLDDASMMDYYTENEGIYNKKEKYLGIPFPNSDLFSVSGEGVGGSFRPYRSEFGQYRKNKITSNTETYTISGDLSAGAGITSVGSELGGAFQSTEIKAWDKVQGDASFLSSDAYKLGSNEKYHLRYNLDKGGEFRQATTEEVSALSYSDGDPKVSFVGVNAINADRSSRLTYIDHNYNAAFGETILKPDGVTPLSYKANEQALYIRDFVSPSTGQVIEFNRSIYPVSGLGEMATYGSNGTKYTYGLPTHTKNEQQISYQLSRSEFTDAGTEGVIANPNSPSTLDANSPTKQGYRSETPYATQFLLTQITSSDYIDRTFNGPSPDDFGSYTRFNYARYAGGSNWYQYRSPFEGLDYSEGSLTDNKDNLGQFVSGEKELNYLESVASKTHVAIFKTSPRSDGLGLSKDKTDLIKGGIEDNSVALQKLDRIDLYAIEDCTDEDNNGFYEPKDDVNTIKTVHFEYTYELCKNVPNNNGTADHNYAGVDINSSATGGGKLTLKKVWFEYEGQLTDKISPYEFEYQYPIFSEASEVPIGQLKAPYPNTYGETQSDPLQLFHYGNDYPVNSQNPPYEPVNTDRWGCYRDYDAVKTAFGNDLPRFFPYVHQDPADDFDQAAWCLKKINLPTGGSILVQYEQNTYKYVQDQRAMAMVPLMNTNGSSDKRFYLDLAKTGIDFVAASDKMALLKELFEPMERDHKRIYFKFLYALLGTDVKYFNGMSDYVDGFAYIKSVGFDTDGAYFSFNENDFVTNQGFSIENNGGHGDEIPQKVCQEMYSATREGLLPAQTEFNDSDIDSKTKMLEVFKQWSDLTDFDFSCAAMDEAMSFVRLQLPNNQPKIGGGVRVKRLLMYDEGITDKGQAVIYGNEYEYKDGVASYEPTSGGEENPLVYPLEMNKTRKLGIIATNSRYSRVGPLGESFYPSASIGYSQVKVANIHQGKTSTGFTVHKFHTCKDFPIRKESSVLIPNPQKNVNTGSLGAVAEGASFGGSVKVEEIDVSQGYTFINDNMHGQPISVKQFASNTTIPLAGTIYEYYDATQGVPVLDGTGGTPQYEMLGVESEVLAENREVKDEMINGLIGSDFAVTFAPLFTAYPTKVSAHTSLSSSTVHTHVTNKLINYPVFVKKVRNISPDKIEHVTENVAFDKYTGEPVTVKTYDEFEQAYKAKQVRGTWEYPSLQSKGVNEGMVTQSKLLLDENGTYLDFNYPEMTDCNAMNKFTAGDYLEVKDPVTSNFKLFHVGEVDEENLRVRLISTGLDGNGSLVGGELVDIEVLRSGNKNNLMMDIAQVTQRDDGTGGFSTDPDIIVSESAKNADAFIVDLNTALDDYFKANGVVSGIVKLPVANAYSGISLYVPSSPTLEETCDAGDIIEKVEFDLTIDNTNGTDFLTLDVRSFDIVKPNNDRFPQVCQPDLTAPFILWGKSDNGENTDCISSNQTIDNHVYCFHPNFQTQNRLWIDEGCNGIADYLWSETIHKKAGETVCYVISYEENDKIGLMSNMSKKWDRDNNKWIDIWTFLDNSTTHPGISFSGIGYDYARFNYADLNQTNSIGIKSAPLTKGVYSFESTSFYDQHGGDDQGDEGGLFGSNSANGDCRDFDMTLSGYVCVDYNLPDYNVTYTGANTWIGQNYDFSFQATPLAGSTPHGENSFDWKLINFITKDTIDSSTNQNPQWTLSNPGVYQVKLVVTHSDEGEQTITSTPILIRDNADACQCDNRFPSLNLSNSSVFDPQGSGHNFTDLIGNFAQSLKTGGIFYQSKDCPLNRKVSCMEICSPNMPSTTPDDFTNVVSASASTLSDNWPIEAEDRLTVDTDFDNTLFNEYELGEKGNWRVKESYAYRTSLDPLNESENFDRGMFDYTHFDWHGANGEEWVKTTTVNSYDFNGQPVEDQNILNVKSGALYGYNHTLPIMVAQNAPQNQLIYEGFEQTYLRGSDTYLESGPLLNPISASIDAQSHTGSDGLKINSNQSVELGIVNRLNANQKYFSRVWVHSSNEERVVDGRLKLGLTPMPGTYAYSQGHTLDTYNFNKISSSGEWTLYEAVFEDGHNPNGPASQGDWKVSIELEGTFSNGVIIDDFRLQPYDAEAICYVYDHAQRLVAVMDDQHFASLYQYNAEGALVRKLKETTRGVKTISETQYNTKGVKRADF